SADEDFAVGLADERIDLPARAGIEAGIECADRVPVEPGNVQAPLQVHVLKVATGEDFAVWLNNERINIDGMHVLGVARSVGLHARNERVAGSAAIEASEGPCV